MTPIVTALMAHVARLETAGLHDLVAEAREIARRMAPVERSWIAIVEDAAEDACAVKQAPNVVWMEPLLRRAGVPVFLVGEKT